MEIENSNNNNNNDDTKSSELQLVNDLIQEKLKQLELSTAEEKKTNKKIAKHIADLKPTLDSLKSADEKKLESLARELQKRNAHIIEEGKRLSNEEEHKRDLLSEKFSSSVKDLNSRLEEFHTQRESHSQHIELLQNKLKSFAEQFDIREKHFATILKAKELEKQLLEAKLKQQTDLTRQESIRSKAYQDEIEKTIREEIISKEKIKICESQLDQFKVLLANFDAKSDKIEKFNRLLEKENNMLKAKTNQSDRILIEMAEESIIQKKQIETLKNLSKSLSNERNELKSQITALKSENKIQDNSLETVQKDDTATTEIVTSNDENKIQETTKKNQSTTSLSDTPEKKKVNKKKEVEEEDNVEEDDHQDDVEEEEEPEQGSDEEEKTKKKPPAKKSKTAASSSKPKFVDLGNNRRISYSTFVKGDPRIDFREFYQDKSTGELKPGSKGLLLTLAQWKLLKDNIKEVDSWFE
eukprot:gene10832-13276_t